MTALKIVFVGPSRSGKSMVLAVFKNPAQIAPMMSIFRGTVDPLNESFVLNGVRIEAIDTPGLFESNSNSNVRNNENLLNSIRESLENFADGEHVEVIFCSGVSAGITYESTQSLILYRNMFQSLVNDEKMKSFRFTILITRREDYKLNCNDNTDIRNQILMHQSFMNFIPSSTSNAVLQESDIFFSGCLDVGTFDLESTSEELNWDLVSNVKHILQYRFALLQRLGLDGQTIEPEVVNYFKALNEERRKKNENERDLPRLRNLYSRTTRIPEFRMADAMQFLLIERRTRSNRFNSFAVPVFIRRMVVEQFFGVPVNPVPQHEPRILVQIDNRVVELLPREENQMRAVNDITEVQLNNVDDQQNNENTIDNNRFIRSNYNAYHGSDDSHLDGLRDNHFAEMIENNNNNDQNLAPARGNRLLQMVLQRPQYAIGGLVLFLSTIYGGGSWLNWF